MSRRPGDWPILPKLKWIWTRLEALIRASAFAELSSRHLPADAAKRYRRDQIVDTLDQTALLLLGNTVFAPVMAYQGLQTGSIPLLIAWTVLMVVGSWWLYLWTRPLRRCSGTEADMRRLKIRALIDSSLWCLGTALIYPHASGDGKVLVAIILTGAVALGTFGYSRSAGPGMIYLAIMCVGIGIIAFVTGLTVGTLSDLMVPFLSAFAFLALSKSVLDRGRASLMSFQNVEKLSEKTEMVELLIKDYEAKATEWIWQTDAKGRVTAAPDLIFQFLGGAEEMADRAVLHRVGEKISTESAAEFERMADAVRNRAEFHDIVLAFPDEGQMHGLRWLAVKGRPQFDRGTFQGFRGIIADATKATEAERQVKQ
ncbi:MAG: hypothetical protein AAGA87_10945, partial [Pseudomonadota bacterium]